MLTLTVLEIVTDMVKITFAIKIAYHVCAFYRHYYRQYAINVWIFDLYLHLTLANSNGHGQDHTHFDSN